MNFRPPHNRSIDRLVVVNRGDDQTGPAQPEPVEPLPIGFAEPDCACHHCGGPTVPWDNVCLRCRGRRNQPNEAS